MDRSDEALLEAAARGDDDAFAAFYRRYVPAVTGFFLRRVGDGELAFDLTAETFAAVAAGCGRFRAGEAPAGAWLFGIAANKLRESLRRGRVEADARRRLGLEAMRLKTATFCASRSWPARGRARPRPWSSSFHLSSATRWWPG